MNKKMKSVLVLICRLNAGKYSYLDRDSNTRTLISIITSDHYQTGQSLDPAQKRNLIL